MIGSWSAELLQPALCSPRVFDKFAELVLLVTHAKTFAVIAAFVHRRKEHAG
jgi:hypothetical protein